MLNWLRMMGTYESRKVDRYDEGDLMVSTALVTDSDQPYETAVCHPAYNNGKHVIVEMYDTKDEAQTGHGRWVKKMTAKRLPKKLVDVSTSEIAKFCDAVQLDDSGNWRENANE